MNHTFSSIANWKSANEMVNNLRTLADQIQAVDGQNFFDIWMLILQTMEKHNREFSKDIIGKSMSQVVVEELERLYALDKTAKLALKTK